MERQPKKFIVPISDIYATDKVMVKFGFVTLSGILTLWNPALKDKFPTVHNLDPEQFTEHGSGAWDARRRHKSLCVLSEHDRIPPNWASDATDEHLRPVLTLSTLPDGSPKGMLKLRDLVFKGQKGHDHAPYYEHQEFEDVEFIPGTMEEMTDEEYKNRYMRFPDWPS